MNHKRDKQVIKDNRVIDLKNNIDLTNNIPWPSEPIQLTLCAGDGRQNYNDTMVTDIEWFTTGKKGFSREHKPTNVFCCSPDYNVPGLKQNKEYLEQHKQLNILLVLCDTNNPLHMQRFEELFRGRITTIHEDMSCYGPVLRTNILDKVLITGGQYIIDDHRKYKDYPRTDEKFTYQLEAPNKLIITKISPTEEPLSSQDNLLPRATKKRQLAGTRRKKRKVNMKGNNNKKKEGGREGTYGSLRKIEPINK